MVEVNYYGVEFVNMDKEIVGLWELELELEFVWAT